MAERTLQSERTLLIDGDVLAFTAASACQYVHEDEFGYVYPVAHKPVGETVLENLMFSIRDAFSATHVRVALTDPKDNWRFEVDPSYKGNRKDNARPLLLDYLKSYLKSTYGAEVWPGLEADDVLGILLTEPQAYPGERILVGRDKDFLTVPGKYHRLKDYTPGGKPVVKESTEWQARRWHMCQTLAGDRTDGYPGCPGVGMERAQGIIDDPKLLVPQQGVITRGVNKGQSVTKWVAEPSTDYWAVIVSNYLKGGATEEDALRTARLAHILHHEDYNRETGEVRLWTPDKLGNISKERELY